MREIPNFIQIDPKEINKNKDVKFFVSTSDEKTLMTLIKKYGSRILYFKNRFGSKNEHFYVTSEEKDFCSKNKNLNGLVDMILLSKCNVIYGDMATSFPITARFMNSNAKYIWRKYIPPKK